MLEDALQPQRLYWLVHAEVPSLDPAGVRAVMDHIRESMSTHKATLAPYQREVMQVYAALWLRLNKAPGDHARGGSRYTVRGIEETGLACPTLTEEVVWQLCNELVHAPDPRYDAVRLLLHTFVCDRFGAQPSARVDVEEPAETVTRSLRRILDRYAPECTFKTRGDFNVHSELLINKLPAWVSSAMVHNEMPYPLMVRVYPTDVNRVVRPLLDRAITDSLDMVDFRATTFVASDFITMMCLIIEILASSKVHVLINAAAVRNPEMTWPLPYLWRDTNGVLQHGVRSEGRFNVFPADTSATAACVAWLKMCHDCSFAPCKNLAELLFTPSTAAERNPLKKFLFITDDGA